LPKAVYQQVFQLVGLGRGVTVASSTSEAIERSSSTVVA
jgi:hypothetical protein